MKDYRYFAFISYSRTDMKAATFIQSELEHFRYPKDSIKPEYLPNDPVFVREVFLDKTGLSGQGESFEKKLDDALATSRYLIVLCSPEAAKAKNDPKAKHYVEWEIKTFLKHHGEQAVKRIIPIVLDGEPNIGENSCLPKPLRTDEFTSRNLPDMRPPKAEPLGFFGRKKPWHAAIVTLLSYIFDVERSIIFDRFTAERAKMRLKIGIVASITIALCLLIAAWALFEQSRQKDAAATKCLVEATYEFGASSGGDTFRASDLALSSLSRAGRLPVAREFLHGQLLQRSWIVPLFEDTNVTTYATSFHHSVNMRGRNIVVPDGLPISFVTTNDLEAIESTSQTVLWSKPALGFTSGEVDPTGVLLVLSRWNPEHALLAVDPFTGRELWQRKTGGLVRKMSFSPDGRRLAILSSDGLVTILNTRDGTVPFETYCAGPDVFNIAFSRDCGRLLLAKKGRILVCSILKTATELPIKPLGAPLLAVDVSEDHSLMAMLSCIREGSISLELRNPKTLEILSRREISDDSPYIVALSQDGRRIAVGGGDSAHFSVFTINDTNALAQTFQASLKKRLANIVAVPDGFLICEDSDCSLNEKPSPRLLLWQVLKPSELQDVTPNATLPISVIRGGTGQLHVLTANAVVTIDATTRKEIKRFTTPVRCETIACSDDERIILSTRLNRQAFAFDKDGHELFRTPHYSEPGVLPMTISSDGSYCAVAVSPKGVQVFDTDAGTPVSRIFNMPEKIEGLQFVGTASNLRLLVCGGPELTNLQPHSAYYAIINPIKNQLVRLRNGLSDRLSNIHHLGPNALFLSGLNCSYAYLLPLDNQAEELPIKGFADICQTLAGRTVLDNGVSIPQNVIYNHHSTAGKWDVFMSEAKLPPNRRHISFESDISLSDVLKALESGYFDEYDFGLTLDPSHEPFLASYWIGFAQRILKARYKFRHPEMSQRDLDMHFVSLSAEQWSHDIFNDPQTRFFCDSWTKHLLMLYPNSKLAQHEREVFLNHTQLPKPKQFDVQSTKTAWKAFCAQPNVDPLHNVIVREAADAYSQSEAAFSEFMESLKVLIVKHLKAGDLDYLKINSLVTLLGQEIEVWAHVIPHGDAVNSKILEELIAATHDCQPPAMARILQCYLQLSLAESYLLQGNSQKASISIDKALQSDDVVLKPMMPVYEAYLALAKGDGKEAARLLNAFLKDYKNTYGAECQEAVSRQIWLFLAYLQQTGLSLGDFKPTFDALTRQFLNGVEIRVSPEGEASRMGWRDGDRLLKINGVNVLDARHLTALFARRRLKAEHETVFVLKRGEQTYTTKSAAPLLGFFY